MTEEISASVAIAAALVAALSALYARWQAKAAVQANEIALHENRLSIYNGLARFRVHIVGRGAAITEEELWRFAEIAERSEFYFPADIYEKINTLYEQGLRLMSLHEQWKELQELDPEKARTLARPKQEFMRETRDECFKVSEQLKSHLRIGTA